MVEEDVEVTGKEKGGVRSGWCQSDDEEGTKRAL